MLKFDLTLFNNNTEGERYSDMSAVDIKVGVVLGQIRVVFLNKFVTDLLVSSFLYFRQSYGFFCTFKCLKLGHHIFKVIGALSSITFQIYFLTQ